jgi:demethylmenaquinone methyltransferase/2-methoxy-6-polyprenyl-1,4-benzoquinol methylase
MSFSRADAFALPDELGKFEGAFVGFFWSHIPRAEIQRFLRSLHRRLAPGAVVLILDNRFVTGSSTPLSRRDPSSADTYQMRTLNDGSTHEVLKNFPSESELRGALADHPATDVRFESLEYFWTLQYRWAGA